MRAAILVLSLAVLPLAVTLRATPSSQDNTSRQTLLSMLIGADVVEAGAHSTSGALQATESLVPLSTLHRQVAPSEKRFLVEKDGWGGDILYWSDGWNYMLLSLGSDGEPEIDYGARTPPYFGAPLGLVTDSTQDIIVVNGQTQRGPFLPRQAVPSSMAALRAVGTACEEYAIDNNFYPNPGTALSQVAAIEPQVSPYYISVLPKTDGWGWPILYWTNIAGRPYANDYAVISVGADGTADSRYETWTTSDFIKNATGMVTDLRRDTIFMDGQFLQFPQGISTPADMARQTLADARAIGTAIEEYSIDNNYYPTSGGSIASLSALTALLSPAYIRVLPTSDGWRHPYQYWSSGSVYWVVSAGADGVQDFPYQSWTASEFLSYRGGMTTNLDRDIIFANGQFIQYPQVGSPQ